MDPTAAPGALADAIGAAVLADPAVLRLDGGAFGAVATALPGRRVVGVRVGAPGDPIEVSVVLAMGTPVPAAAARVRGAVRALAGPVPVDVHVSDVDVP
ncbi:hypothetical protein L6E12_20550 [Actinokineospora sp. PR83]|uniref:hypothetical protein n=1 Tax=Actinokineospora sp. PR83 TaxID=2884908 RepID=UPI0027E013CB|nr:hypothetical protein [Actinokineospora sp. PR83]MCG8918177.1 hypothetical protein [Actinokineospora sp. PR83]